MQLTPTSSQGPPQIANPITYLTPPPAPLTEVEYPDKRKLSRVDKTPPQIANTIT